MDFRNLSARTGVQRDDQGIDFRGNATVDLVDWRDVRGEGMRAYGVCVVGALLCITVKSGLVRIDSDGGKAESGPDGFAD